MTVSIADLALYAAALLALFLTPGPVWLALLARAISGGFALGLFGRADLAKDQGRPDATLGTGAVTLAQNFPDRKAVDAAFDRAIAAGATPLKRPEPVFWGGYSGYFADPDGHVWELAHNPFWPLDDDGWLAG